MVSPLRTLRPAGEDDIPAIMEVIRAVVPVMQSQGNFQWSEEYPNEAVLLNDLKSGHLWVCCDGTGRVVGTASYTEEQYPEYAQLGWDLTERALVVHRMAVHPDFQRQGIAKRLMVESEAEARRRGLKLLRADTNAKNVSMNNFFTLLGYKLAGSIRMRGQQLFNGYEKILG